MSDRAELITGPSSLDLYLGRDRSACRDVVVIRKKASKVIPEVVSVPAGTRHIKMHLNMQRMLRAARIERNVLGTDNK